ncbi:MAG: hypothetical protein UD759_03035 [Clostridia bacterium]|nr:hypothetical protein [Clostridia bacterium]
MIRNKNFLLTVILPIFISIIAGIVIIVLNSKSILLTRATASVEAEKRAMTHEMSELNSEKDELTAISAEYDKTLEENKFLLGEVTRLTEDLANCITEIENAGLIIKELDTAIETKTAFNNSLEGVTASKPGDTLKFTNKKLNIPTDLKAGRYKAEGTGTLMIYTIAGTLQDKKNLSLTDTNTYTFDIASGQSLKIEGTLSITQILE